MEIVYYYFSRFKVTRFFFFGRKKGRYFSITVLIGQYISFTGGRKCCDFRKYHFTKFGGENMIIIGLDITLDQNACSIAL